MYEFLELYDEKGLKRIKEGDILLEKKCSSTEYFYHLVLSMNVAILLVESKMMVGSFRQNC